MFTAAAREAAPIGPMTADTPLQNVLGMGQMALQNVGAPLPNVRGVHRLGQAIPGGQTATQTAMRGVTEAIPGGEDVPRWAQERGITRDTPVLGGALTPDVAIPVATGILAGDPETLTGVGRRLGDAWAEHVSRSQRMGITPGAYGANIPPENPLDRLDALRQASDDAPDLIDENDAGALAKLQAGMTRRMEDWESLSRESEQLQEQIGMLSEMATQKLERPPNRGVWAMGGKKGLTQGDYHEIARRSELNPYEPGWYQNVDDETVRLYKQEVMTERGRIVPETPEKELQRIRARERDVRKQAKQLEQRLMQDTETQIRLEETLATKGVTPAAPEPEAAPVAGEPLLPRAPAAPAGPRAPGTVRIRARPAPPPRAPEQGRVMYPTPEGVAPQAAVPTRAGQALPPPPRGPVEPMGTNAQGALIDPATGAPTGPTAIGPRMVNPPPPETPSSGTRILSETPSSGTPQMELGQMPGTEVGTAYPERFPPQRDPGGVAITASGRTPLEPDVEVGRAYPGTAPPNPIEVPGTRVRMRDSNERGEVVGVFRSTPDQPPNLIEVRMDSGRVETVHRDFVRPEAGGFQVRSAVQPSGTSQMQMAGMPEPEAGAAYPENFPPQRNPGGAAITASGRTPVEPDVEVGRVYPENAPDPNAPMAPPTTVPPPRPPPPVDRNAPLPEGPEPMRQPTLEVDGDSLDAQVPELTPGTAKAANWMQRKAKVLNQSRYISLLSGTASAFGDVISNAMNIPRLYGRTAIGASIEGGAQAIGKLTQEQRATTRSQLTGLNRGMREGGMQGVREAFDVLMHGYSRAAEQLNPGNSPQINPDVPQESFRGPKWLPLTVGYRIRLAADSLVTTMGERMASYAMGYREADRAGLRPGTAPHTEYAEAVTRQVQNSMENLRRDLEPGQRLPQGGVTQRQAAGTTYDRPGQRGETVTPGRNGVRSPFGDRLDYESLAKEAFTMSRDLAFQRDLGRASEAVAGLRTQVPLLQAVVPFYRTTSRIAADMVQQHPVLGPIGTTQDAIKAAFGQGPYADLGEGGSLLTRSRDASTLPMSQRLADHALGAMGATVGASMAAAGVITALGPNDAAVRRRMMDEGWRPLSLVIPDGQGGVKGYIPLTRLLGPHAMSLGLGAAMFERAERGQGQPPDEVLKDFLLAQEGQWSTQSGLRDLYELLLIPFSPDPEEAGRAAGRMAARVVSQYIPMVGLQRQIAAAFDPVARDPRSFREYLAQDVLPFRHEADPRTTQTGEVVERGPNERGWRSFLPLAEIEARPGQRQFYGSQDAAQDAEITRAINTVRNWERDPDQYTAPSQRQQALYDQFAGTGDPDFSYNRREERRRRQVRAREDEDTFLGFRMPTSTSP